MSDFPSISDLVGKGSQAGGVPASSQKPSYQSTGVKFAKKMEQITIKEKEQLVEQQAAALGLPYIDLATFPVPSEALRVIPEEQAAETGLVCFYFASGDLRVGAVNPTDEIKTMARELGEHWHAPVSLYLISEHSFTRVLELYKNLPVVRPITKDIVITDEELNRYEVGIENLESLSEAFQNVSISDILTLMIAAALKINATDIHVEAEETGVAMRYRVDGILHEVTRLPKDQWKRFVARIKLLAALKINITDRPQDGRVTLQLSSGSLDVRVSTLPTMHGESVVMRILHSGSTGVSFDELGLIGGAYERLKEQVLRPNGMIITTGPTGSGKTTTMYAVMRLLNKPGVKIITLEDPIEIKIQGINQSQVDPSHDYTFAKGLRSILRQDPDICMVGEIRDLETAEIAIQAALTGHLMLSTIHTNSAAGAVPRFLSMGVKPFLLAPALNAIIGQRLVRRICEHCKTAVALSPEQKERVEKIMANLPKAAHPEGSPFGEGMDLVSAQFYRGSGCPKCSGLGYKGRIGIYEIFVMNKEVETVILSAAVSEYTIQELALKQGMITMAQDGILKAMKGITSLEEVFRVAE